MRANTDAETFDYKFRCDGVSSAGHGIRTLKIDDFVARNKQR